MNTSTGVRNVLSIDEYMANVGVDMLHPGGMRRTRDLAEMCGLSEGKRVLDVGCGLGRTARYLAREYECNVVGLDVSEKMIRGARKNAVRGGADTMVDFEVSSAEHIPFRDETYDVVISEGTVVLVDKRRALKECARVTRHGGYVGLNELSWRTRPMRELMEKTAAELQGVNPLEYGEWAELLADSGLVDVKSRTFRYKSTSLDVIGSLGLRALVRVGVKYISEPEIRKWVDRQESLFREYSDYWGYGLYVGRKPSNQPLKTYRRDA